MKCRSGGSRMVEYHPPSVLRPEYEACVPRTVPTSLGSGPMSSPRCTGKSGSTLRCPPLPRASGTSPPPARPLADTQARPPIRLSARRRPYTRPSAGSSVHLPTNPPARPLPRPPYRPTDRPTGRPPPRPPARPQARMFRPGKNSQACDRRGCCYTVLSCFAASLYCFAVLFLPPTHHTPSPMLTRVARARRILLRAN